jgi:hypothetical protein
VKLMPELEVEFFPARGEWCSQLQLSGVPLFFFLLFKSDGEYCTFGGRLFF